MSEDKRRYRIHSVEFKKKLVLKRLSGERSLKSLAREHEISPENIIKWARRYLAGEPLEMKKGHKKKPEEIDLSSASEKDLLDEIVKLRVELAYKNEVISVLESREELKKRTIPNHKWTIQDTLG